MDKHFCEGILERIRKESGESLESASTKIGMSRQRLRRIENGEVPIDVETLVGLSEMYGYSLVLRLEKKDLESYTGIDLLHIQEDPDESSDEVSE